MQSQQERDLIRNLYQNHTVNEIAEKIGISASAVRNRIWRLGLKTKHKEWSEGEIIELRKAYEGKQFGRDIGLSELALKLGRNKGNVCRKAKSLGLTNHRRPICKRSPKKKKPRVESPKTPARFTGKRHSESTCKAISEAGKKRWAMLTREQADEIHTKRLKSIFMKRGSLNFNQTYARGTWKAGWRQIGDVRKYYRSRWEANYARYLQWLKENGQIKDWKHETETFWFEEIRRGVRSYLPDFRVWENDGTSCLHEVKGWMDDRSKTSLKRMAKYHPDQKIILIREKNYNEIKRKVSRIIKEWE